MTNSTEQEGELVVGPFLLLLESDIQANPKRLKPQALSVRCKIKSLLAGIEVDLNEPLSDDE